MTPSEFRSGTHDWNSTGRKISACCWDSTAGTSSADNTTGGEQRPKDIIGKGSDEVTVVGSTII